MFNDATMLKFTSNRNIKFKISLLKIKKVYKSLKILECKYKYKVSEMSCFQHIPRKIHSQCLRSISALTFSFCFILNFIHLTLKQRDASSLNGSN